MDHYLLDIINEATEYVEEHLLEESLCLDSISSHVKVSKFHLLRIWKGATSTGLMEYVRRRRVALSLADLLESKRSLEFISWKYSFSCQRTFSRVFKNEFGMTPAQWRSHPVPLQVLDRFNVEFLSRAGEGLVFFKATEILPAFDLAGYEYEVGVEDNHLHQTANKLGVEFFNKHRARIANPLEKDVYIGFTTIPAVFAGFTRYLPSVPVGPASIVPKDMACRHVKAHRYGVFTYIGLHRPEEISSATLGAIWHQVFHIWMPTVEIKLPEAFSFERIDYARCSRQYCECDLYYPIKPVQESDRRSR